VLCEKPVGLSADEARELLRARGRHGVLIAEAFMVRCHPQWEWVEEQVRGGRIGAVHAIQGFFSYTNTDPANIRNQPGCGGGGLMDIGCYPVHLSRFVFGCEPSRALALAEFDPAFGTDRLTSAILDFGGGHATFTCATQASACQRMIVVGAQGRIELEIPFNPPPDRAVRAFFDPGTPLTGERRVQTEFGPCDQHTLQADRFALAAWGEQKFPVDLEDSVANMETLDALARSIRSGGWERPGPAR
jgi:predicted dehydrogenase